MIRRGSPLVAIFVLASAAVGLPGCQQAEVAPAAATYDGRNLYLGYCASCHGAEGAGDGPVAPAFAATVPDLRTLSARRGGFDEAWLKEIIDGRTLRAAHGTTEMPVWGWQFRLVEDSEAEVTARIDALVEHLRSIQTSG